jgi:hypothetical protein
LVFWSGFSKGLGSFGLLVRVFIAILKISLSLTTIDASILSHGGKRYILPMVHQQHGIFLATGIINDTSSSVINNVPLIRMFLYLSQVIMLILFIIQELGGQKKIENMQVEKERIQKVHFQ